MLHSNHGFYHVSVLVVLAVHHSVVRAAAIVGRHFVAVAFGAFGRLSDRNAQTLTNAVGCGNHSWVFFSLSLASH